MLMNLLIFIVGNKVIMKKLLLFLLLILLIDINVYAHPGRTDSNGGHHDYSADEYHYHHGHEAHQHPNGQCPYDSSTSNKRDFTDDDLISPIINFIDDTDLDILFIGLACSIGMYLLYELKEWVSNLLYRHKLKKRSKKKK